MQVPPRYHGFRGRFKRLKRKQLLFEDKSTKFASTNYNCSVKKKNPAANKTSELYCNQLRNASTY